MAQKFKTTIKLLYIVIQSTLLKESSCHLFSFLSIKQFGNHHSITVDIGERNEK